MSHSFQSVSQSGFCACSIPLKRLRVLLIAPPIPQVQPDYRSRGGSLTLTKGVGKYHCSSGYSEWILLRKSGVVGLDYVRKREMVMWKSGRSLKWRERAITVVLFYF